MEKNTPSGGRSYRIPYEKRQDCLRLFEQGFGYKYTAHNLNLNLYTVRDYKRRFRHGDTSWAVRGTRVDPNDFIE